jgi:ATP-dependent Clp protease adaptor protein ClpS
MSKTAELQLTLNHGDVENNDPNPDSVGDLMVQERQQETAPPPLYKVIMLDDDFTPMDFVVEVLEKFFNMSNDQATHVMMTVHTQGKAVCGLFTKDVAETKVAQVMRYAQESQHPLMCELEVDDEAQ